MKPYFTLSVHSFISAPLFSFLPILCLIITFRSVNKLTVRSFYFLSISSSLLWGLSYLTSAKFSGLLTPFPSLSAFDNWFFLYNSCNFCYFVCFSVTPSSFVGRRPVWNFPLTASLSRSLVCPLSNQMENGREGERAAQSWCNSGWDGRY